MSLLPRTYVLFGEPVSSACSIFVRIVSAAMPRSLGLLIFTRPGRHRQYGGWSAAVSKAADQESGGLLLCMSMGVHRRRSPSGMYLGERR
jgi:hypothetical protein